jgi:N-methylhydantoinase A
MRLRLATDIGGTFTDLVGFDEQTGALTIGKASTTPDDLPQGVLDAVAAAGVSLEDVAEFVHGTTVVINALTERSGARTALVTTHGFRDVLEIGRGNRPDMYNLVSRKPPPFVPRRHRFEVRERVDRHGVVLLPLELDDL